MNRKIRVFGGIALGALALIFILLGPAAPLFVRLGVKPICIQGDLPNLQIVPCPDLAESQLTSTPITLPTPAETTPIPIIVDDDGSPDGIIALLYFLRHPHYEVQAVTISPGEAHPDLFASHVTRLLAAVGRAEIPVGVGRATPLEGDNAFPDPWRQASDEFWGLSLPEAAPGAGPQPAAELIVDTLSAAQRPTAVFVSGPHTNLAEALRLDPSIGEDIREILVMGGSIYKPGNIASDWPAIDNRAAEWNIWVDPVAAWEVLAAGLPVQLMPLDGTNQVLWSDSDARAWASSGTPEGSIAADLLRRMLDSWSVEEAYIWDLAAAVATTDGQLCPEVTLALDIELEAGPEQGRTFVLDGPANAGVCLEPDPDRVRARAASILGR